ncbi:type II secretion system protein F [Nocardioides mangrovicus]|uniref:Type II secretion system protein F n=1 Tax=Nocardioides mangrovicus TaxID=2478913 RepID=A0A3L8P129_9ACTN|nr:type II secretion system F family protein [Nocardioides mangrovicus]RLV49150.1 type II secretion system protein F [Nocardioides mangrovicus]
MDALRNVDPSAVMMIGGIVAILFGALAVIFGMGLVSARPATGGKDAVSDQINAYGAAGVAARAADRKKQAEAASIAAAAKSKMTEVLANNQSFEAKIAKRLEGSGHSMKPAEWVLLHAGMVVGSALFWILLSGGRLPFMIVGIVIGVFVPWIYLGFKRSRRLKAFESMLPDTLQLMSSSLSAGLSLAQSVDTIVREGAEPVSSEFRRVVVESRLGVALEDAMQGVAERMESKDFEWVVMAIRIQREVGGNLAELLLTVAATLREREYIRRHVRALAAEGRLSMYVLGGLPPVFLLYLALTKWTYVKPLFTSGIGYVLLGAISILLSVGVFWMSKVSKVEL